MSKAGWQCTECTYENDASSKACEMCETAKPLAYAVRFKTPTELFTLHDLPPHTTVEVMKVMLESRSGIPVKQQKLFYGSPRRELFGREKEHLMKVLELKPTKENEATTTITVEIKGVTGASSSSSSKPKQTNEWGEFVDSDELGGTDDWHHQKDDENINDEENFIAWLEHDPSGSSAVAPAPSPTSTTVAGSGQSDAEDEVDPFADGADDGGDGWGDCAGGDGDGDDFGDEFMDDDAVDEEMRVKQASEKKSAVSSAVLQSSKDNKKLGQYEILTLPTLLTMMKKSLAELNETLGCTMSEGAILMRSYRWNKDRLFQEYLENPAKIQEKCGLVHMKLSNESASTAAASSSKATATAATHSYGDCSLCGEAMTSANSLDLGCTTDGSHRFCNECWRNWASAEMDKGPSALSTTCCGFKCREIIPGDIFLNLLDLKKRKLLSKWFIRNYVDSKPNLKWCVNSRCTKIVRFGQGGARDIECECGTRFCFACGLNESHSPCQCELVKQWNSKNSSDKENNDWLLANTKPCPGCKTHTEKNSGCNHMTCKHCKHEYCWLCLQDWSKHGAASGGYYKCNVYETVKQESKSGITNQEKIMADAQAKIAKYQFYFTRWMEYEKSIKAAVRTISTTEERMESLQGLTGGDLKSVEYLLDANKTVIECRRALKWSYIIAFYLPAGSRQLTMFEMDQGQLEKFSDELHGLIELPIECLVPEINASSPPPATKATPPKPTPKSPPPPVVQAKPSTTPTSKTGASSSSSSSSTTPKPEAIPTINLRGEALKQAIIRLTVVANKYLSNLVDACFSGQYIDLTLQRLPSS